MKKLYFGDNLDIMREHIADESVNLVYLDPPYDSELYTQILWTLAKSKLIAEEGSHLPQDFHAFRN